VKESVIAVEVFDRRADEFDPGSDSVVRVQARRLRAKATYVDQFETAQIRVGLGDVDGAINCLERAARERTSFLVFSNVWPGFEILRIASRYDAILSQLSLKPVLSADARLGSPQPDLRQA
jgi:hypothetical protein